MYYLELSKLVGICENWLNTCYHSLYASGLRVIIDQGTNTIKKARICELPGVSTPGAKLLKLAPVHVF